MWVWHMFDIRCEGCTCVSNYYILHITNFFFGLNVTIDYCFLEETLELHHGNDFITPLFHSSLDDKLSNIISLRSVTIRPFVMLCAYERLFAWVLKTLPCILYCQYFASMTELMIINNQQQFGSIQFSSGISNLNCLNFLRLTPIQNVKSLAKTIQIKPFEDFSN